MEVFAWGGEVPEGLDGEFGLALLQAVPVKGGVQGPALEGCSEELGVAEGGLREGGGALGVGGSGGVGC